MSVANHFDDRKIEKAFDDIEVQIINANPDYVISAENVTVNGAKITKLVGCGVVEKPEELIAGYVAQAGNQYYADLEKKLSKVYPEIDLVTTPDGNLVAMVHCNNCTSDLNAWVSALQNLELDGKITGILHTNNDSVADVVKDEGTEVLHGQNYFYEELLGTCAGLIIIDFRIYLRQYLDGRAILHCNNADIILCRNNFTNTLASGQSHQFKRIRISGFIA